MKKYLLFTCILTFVLLLLFICSKKQDLRLKNVAEISVKPLKLIDKIRINEKIKCNFLFTNNTSKPIRLKPGHAQHLYVLDNDTAEIKIMPKSNFVFQVVCWPKHVGPFEGKMTMYTDCSSEPEINLRVSGTVIPNL